MNLELLQRATFAAIGERVYDRLPASAIMQSATCAAETACWRDARGMWVCNPCLSRFRDVDGTVHGPVDANATQRLAEHIRQHLDQRRPMLIAFYCQRHDRFERPLLTPHED
jgi:hypothetical protein